MANAALFVHPLFTFDVMIVSLYEFVCAGFCKRHAISVAT